MGTGYSAKRKHSGSIYVIYRKIRFLLRRGTLFRKHPHVRPYKLKKTSENTVRGSLYHTYRILRYLIVSGKLFHRKNKINKEEALYRRKIIIRKIRYLVRRRKLWHAFTSGLQQLVRRKVAFLRQREYLVILFNSTALFVLAYFLVYLVTQMAVMIAAISFNIDSVLYYYDIDFLIRASEWIPDAVKVVYTTGPFVSLLLALLSMIIYINIAHETWAARLFILWIFCHAFIHFFGELLMGNLLGKGFGHVIMYVVFLDTPKMILTVIDFAIILFTGLILGRYFLFRSEEHTSE